MSTKRNKTIKRAGDTAASLKVLREVRWMRDEVTKLLLDYAITIETDAITHDWLALVTKQLASVCDELRMDEFDPVVAKAVRKKLVLLAAIVAAWAEVLEDES